jgi:hypothetical protein
MKLRNLLTVGGLVALIGISSFNQPFKQAEALLTAPASWTFKYTNEDFPGYKLRNSTSVISTPTYTRTADGAYYNYTSTFTITTGLTAIQTFNRSNTTWYSSSGTYAPNDTKIGSSNAVGTIARKWNLTFNNQTNKNYRLFLDISSSTGMHTPIFLLYNTIDFNFRFHDLNDQVLIQIYIPSYTHVEFYSRSTGDLRYFDAWYLQDLGVSAAYEAGVDDGITQGEQSADSTVLLDAVETVVGIGVNFLLMIMTFSIFDISLLNISLVLIAVIGIVWILKALRG